MLITRRTTLLGLLSTTSLAFLPAPASAETLAELEEAARKEGEIVSLGCPDDWANWGAQWKGIMPRCWAITMCGARKSISTAPSTCRW